ncbi:V-set and transmembrane domain-containing protein 5 [Heteronotia binoei]|uniref:V-set and transmembrane domain-containing protein 5 n=1 Tax=Heteronotia binoei TaxID=13085 RepID=UPI0029312D4C|nr:V-set and transmembrane domain-containing protein 5 [Heteronotia binoei]
MRPLAGLLRIGTLFLTMGWTVQREVSLHVPQPSLNATVAKNVLLSVAYTCKGVPVIEWKHTAAWGTTKIIEWKPGTYTNISSSYRDRVKVYSNGSLQILNVAMRDSGYYLVTVTEEFGKTFYGTILLNVYEIRYEDLHFVVVFFAFLTAVSAALICLMWLCNKSLHLLQKERHKMTESATEETELQMIGC